MTPPAASPLADQETLGEDFVGNFRDSVAIAVRHCRDCQDYHVLSTTRRLLTKDVSINVDRDVLIEATTRLLRARAAETTGRLDVALAGSANTGLLATAARGAYLAGPAIFARTRFTVVDRCGTPLELCRRYGERLGLDVVTHEADAGAAQSTVAADVVLVHSLLWFVPIERHVLTLAALGRWLKPGGRVVFSQSLSAKRGERSVDVPALLAMAEAGRIVLPEPPEALWERARRSAAAPPPLDYAREEQVTDLFDQAGLTIVERQSVIRAPSARKGGSRQRIVAVLAPSAQ